MNAKICKYNPITSLIFSDIRKHLKQWKCLDQESKLLNYIEFKLFLNNEFDLFSFAPKKWEVVISNRILKNIEKINKIQSVKCEIENGLNIYKRLPLSRAKSYLSLDSVKKRKESENNPEKIEKFKKNYGKDLLQMVFNIQHLRIDDKKSDIEIDLFGNKIQFLDQETNQLLLAMFDSKKSKVYFLDIVSHTELKNYNAILGIIVEEKFPAPFDIIESLPCEENLGFTGEQAMGIMLNGGSVLFCINGFSARPINFLMSSGHSNKVIRIYNSIMHNIPNDYYYSDFIYSQ